MHYVNYGPVSLTVNIGSIRLLLSPLPLSFLYLCDIKSYFNHKKVTGYIGNTYTVLFSLKPWK